MAASLDATFTGLYRAKFLVTGSGGTVLTLTNVQVLAGFAANSPARAVLSATYASQAAARTAITESVNFPCFSVLSTVRAAPEGPPAAVDVDIDGVGKPTLLITLMGGGGAHSSIVELTYHHSIVA